MPARVRQVVVVATPVPAELKWYLLDEEPLSLGRSPEGRRPVALPDDKASRSHAVIERDASSDGYVLVDRGSHNGTFLNGVRIDRAPLSGGSVVRIGQTLLVFVEEKLGAGEPLVPESPYLLGHSLRMQRLRGEIAQLAPSPIPVLVLGESGAGKERVAQAIHAASVRPGPLVAINCATIPEPLADAEMFGHAKGAFTGATAESSGLFVAADGGTLFLDEVAELPAAVQAKLLRAIATGEARPLGRSEPRRFDVRLVAATNKDVARAVEEEAFRGDLFARLSGWTLQVPPLRARREDVLRLAEAILARDSGGLPLTTTAAEALLLYDWPYNVRELEQVLAASALRARSEGRLLLSHLPPHLGERVAARAAGAAPMKPPLEVIVPPHAVPDAAGLRAAFGHFEGNLQRVAEYFGRDRKQIYRWAEQQGLDLAALRAPKSPGEE
jgi:DNA-binding NtrC family response regulator